MTDRYRLLRWTLQANGSFSLLSGALILSFARPLAEFMGIPGPLWLWVLGPGLLVFGALVLGLGMRAAPREDLVKWVIRLDWSWVAGSAMVLLAAGSNLSTAGVWLVVDVAVLVAIFAILQQAGLRRVLCARPGTASEGRNI